jgi:colanic acid/amylovoran biosynthesis glycosyltransferase
VRIALVVDDFPSVSQTFIVDKVIGLLERGADVQVVCRRLDLVAWAGYPELAARPEIRARVHAVPGRSPRSFALLATDAVRAAAHPSTLTQFLAARARAARGSSGLGIEMHILTLRPDVVHFEFGWLAKTHGHLADAMDVPMTASFRGADLNYFGLDDDSYYEPVWSRLAAIHCLGDDLWTRALRRGCPPEMPVARIPPAVDIDAYRPPAPRRRSIGDPFRVLTVARLHWKKGFEHGLEAVRRLPESGIDVRYRIAGSGPHLPAVEALIADLGLQDRVELLGSVSRQHVRDELAAADILLHPATSEGFGNAVLEAQAMELPVVTSDADGLPANVQHGTTGYVVPRRDPGALADAMTAIATDPDLARRLGQAGRLRVGTQFRPTEQISAFLDFYAAVADRAAGAGQLGRSGQFGARTKR